MMSAPLEFVPARPLTRHDVRTLVLASLGGALEFYDFIIFVFFTSVIGRLFFPPEMPDWLRQFQAFGIFAVGYLIRPLGGIVMAHFGDISGRKRMFSLGVFMMAVPTLLIGLLPTYQTLGFGAPLILLVLRMFQGAAIGGEVPGSWVFVSEHVPSKKIGFGLGLLTCGLTAGILIGSLVATTINVQFTPDEVQRFAWRIPFILGGIAGLVVVYLRRWLQETPIFLEIRRLALLNQGMPLKAVLKRHGAAVAVSVVMTWMLTAAIVVIILITPTLLGTLGIAPSKVLEANSVATLCMSLSCVVMGIAIDRFGPLKVLLVGSPCLIASSYALYLNAASHPEWLLFLYGMAGFWVGIISVAPIIMVRSFPAAVRFSGISFSYNVPYAVFGGLIPLVVPLVTSRIPLFPAHYVAFASVVTPLVVIVLLRRIAGRHSGIGPQRM